ncbi:MAG: ATP-binding protein [Candidatus Binatia bacterium]|nr:ATP-binding protein [Candidatus Binatia bacterium]
MSAPFATGGGTVVNSQPPEDERRRRRRETWLLIVAGCLFVGLAWWEVSHDPARNAGPMSNNVVSFLLINVNLLLLILLVFLVTRNVAKLVWERRRGIFGSRLRTRLVLAFVALTLAPSILLFWVAQGFLQLAFQTWFNSRVEAALQGSVSIAQSYYQFAANQAFRFARELGRQSQAAGLLATDPTAALQQWVEAKRAEYGLAHIELRGSDQRLLAQASEGDAPRLPEVPTEAARRVARGNDFAETHRWGKADVVRVGVPIHGDGGQVIGSVWVAYVVPRSVAETVRTIARSFEEYRQLNIMRQPVKNSYILTLALLTLVLIFSATWFGIRQARNITRPLLQLAEGTREIARGNWSYRIEPATDEEIAVLVDSFNQMTNQLERTNLELVERRNYVESLLANIAAGVVSLDREGRISSVNPAAERMLGIRLAQVAGARSEEVFVGEQWTPLLEMVQEVSAYPQRDVQQQLRLASGESPLAALVTARSLGDAQGRPNGVILFFEDVTHLLRVQRMEAWREVARRLAHEIKNPLTPIQLSAQRLQKRLAVALDAEGRAILDECVRVIVTQVEEVKKLVDEFSRFARLPAIRLEASDLNKLVEEAVALFRQAHPDLEFVLVADPLLPPLDLDRETLKRALVNLLDNAVAACQAVDGEAKVTVSTLWLGELQTVRLEVADTGCGMSAEVKARLFEPYFSTKKDGTGLGLAIVSSILSEHQAYIRVFDNVPRGTRFVIDFPVRASDRAQAVRVRLAQS